MAGLITKVQTLFNKNKSSVHRFEHQETSAFVEDPEPPTSIEKVFGIQLLLDKILNFAIFDGNGKVDRTTTNACKLVQNVWLERVGVALQNRQPSDYLVTLETNHRWSFSRFANDFENSPTHRIPPVSLIIKMADDPEILTDIFKFVSQFGSGIVHMQLFVCGSLYEWDWQRNLNFRQIFLPLVTAPVRLPQLQSITLNIDFKLFSPSDASSGNLYNWAKNFVYSVLAGCECLQEFTVVAKYGDPLSLSVLFSKNLELPCTVTTVNLNFGCKIGSNLLSETLLDKPLPNLVNLSLGAKFSQYDLAHQLPRVLRKFRHQLQKLKILANTPMTVVNLPTMESLQEFECSASIFEWPNPASSSSSSSSLVGYFPALKKISLWSVVLWPPDGLLKTVEQVTINLEELAGSVADANLLEQMQLLKLAVPNITKLDVTIPYTSEMSHVNFIFCEMTQLTDLSLRFGCSNNIMVSAQVARRWGDDDRFGLEGWCCGTTRLVVE